MRFSFPVTFACAVFLGTIYIFVFIDFNTLRAGLCAGIPSVEPMACMRAWLGATSGWFAVFAAAATIYVLLNHTREMRRSNQFSQFSHLSQIKGALAPEFDLRRHDNEVRSAYYKITGTAVLDREKIREFLRLLIELLRLINENNGNANKYFPEDILEYRSALRNYLIGYIEGWEISQLVHSDKEDKTSLSTERARTFWRHLKLVRNNKDLKNIHGPGEVFFLCMIMTKLDAFMRVAFEFEENLKQERRKNSNEINSHHAPPF
ncbi:MULTISPECIES: hypothetical protein [unclassified Pseudovibrio]|uniref:hypothetical protein n=1 Tax=unclassified Pseudovibrio TaxID=2627060 RepID=UPI0007AE8CD8|nr:MULTISPECIES: hypothetical protein [unclassified Pseudovibrio]KZL02285.1 hypothetical protein PsW74_01383 [Pseudovibrio sp. W74]KZL08171.1 hypothetical protein PsAD14_03318 [Pseudovibrio sp. Ad14]